MEIPEWAAEFVQVRESGCWDWTGNTSRGKVRLPTIRGDVNGMPCLIQVRYLMIGERVGLFHIETDRLLTTCKNKVCVNPDHFIWKSEKNRLDFIKQNGRT